MQSAPLRGLLLVTFMLGGCGDDSDSADASPDEIIDAMPQIDVMNGVVCPNAEASYSAVFVNTSASDDGTNLTFFGDFSADASPDRLRLVVANNATEPLGTFTLPAAEWAVGLCLDFTADACTAVLPAFSGTLVVTSVEDRLKASLTEVIFVDNVATPTCSAALGQATLDVAIDGPP